MNVDYGPCPTCGGTNFKIGRFPHPVVLHWMLNPGLVVNELLLGTRAPAIQLICQGCDLPFIDRAYIPCDKCGVINHGRSWSRRDAFAHWLGLVCPHCGQRIASLWNVFSLLILAVTFPLWYLPYRFYFRDRPARRPTPFHDLTQLTWKHAAAMGIGFGLLMWLSMTCLPLAVQRYRGEPADWSRLWIGTIIWPIAGAFFGYTMQRTLNRKLGPPPK